MRKTLIIEKKSVEINTKKERYLLRKRCISGASKRFQIHSLQVSCLQQDTVDVLTLKRRRVSTGGNVFDSVLARIKKNDERV